MEVGDIYTDGVRYYKISFYVKNKNLGEITKKKIFHCKILGTNSRIGWTEDCLKKMRKVENKLEKELL